MFSYIRGILEEIDEQTVVVETGGIGYEIFLPKTAYEALPHIGSEIRLYTFLQVKEDALSLYGFFEKDTLHLFRQLLSVSGVGPKGALGVLSVLSGDELRVCIAAQDAKAIAKAPGIGTKTAQRIIIDLKDKVQLEDVFSKELQAADEGAAFTEKNTAKKEALEALMALGYSSKEASDALRQVKEEADMRVEDYLKRALSYMG